MPLSPEQLAKQQQTYGNILAGLGGASQILGQGISMIQDAKSINTIAPTVQSDSFGRPMYNLGNFTTQVSAIKPQGSTGGELASSALSGAAAGTAIMPGWGTAIGAVVGFAANALFGRRRKRIQEQKRRTANMNLQAAMSRYNTLVDQFNSNQMAQSLYNERLMESQNRMSNVYQALS